MKVNAEEKLTALIDLVIGFVDAARIQLAQENDFAAKVEQLDKKIDTQEQAINQMSSEIQDLKEHVNMLSTNLEILINELSSEEEDEQEEDLPHTADKHYVNPPVKSARTNLLARQDIEEDEEEEEYEDTFIETDEEIRQFQEDMFQPTGKLN